jgi:Protein of unknown function (DUF3253)
VSDRVADDIDRSILELTAARGPRSSISPSEVAIALQPDGKWQSLLTKVRSRAVALMLEGKIEILRKGKPVEDPEDVRGVIRLRAKS